ncbi:hypothetical protein BO71DRAFT_353280 [Aspergillus ellipticus CBS 707.79]|uniref:Uncharacterized protein n=1 Tax=Aspergillus ellipticus CBS 707.79 TaxID=1448320 RepID=A0A319E1P8_9EURO|nr:hypothetical protein BO71DRAFT_353280 [Aspergillus ellipticus CBS 707.79]
MTSKNLSRTQTDIILAELRADRAAKAPFPIRYLPFDEKFRKDIFYRIPRDVNPDILRRALNLYVKECAIR